VIDDDRRAQWERMRRDAPGWLIGCWWLARWLESWRLFMPISLRGW